MIPRITDLLTLTRPLIGLDLETTGVKPKTSGIVELSLEIMTPSKLPSGEVMVKEYRTLINPLMPIPPDATAIHHITNAMVADSPTFKQLADNLLLGLVNCDFIGYSVRFDLMQIAEEFSRAGKTWSYEGAKILDAYRMWQLVDGRTLSHAVDRWVKPLADADELADLDPTNAHGALWDTRMSSRIAASQLAQTKLPRDLQRLHDLCWPGWFDAEGKLRWNDQGELSIGFGEHNGKNLRHVPRGYLEWMCKKDFSDTVKTACRAALANNWPQRCPDEIPF